MLLGCHFKFKIILVEDYQVQVSSTVKPAFVSPWISNTSVIATLQSCWKCPFKLSTLDIFLIRPPLTKISIPSQQHYPKIWNTSWKMSLLCLQTAPCTRYSFTMVMVSHWTSL